VRDDDFVGFPDTPLGAVLTESDIGRLVGECKLISPFEEGSLQGASYDLSLGKETFVRGGYHILSEEAPSYTLEPGQFILVTSHERLRMPVDVVGHFGLISRWAQRGLISLLSTQIDPGFLGVIVVPLFNAGHAPVPLKLRETIFTIEFVSTTGPTVSWLETHAEQKGISSPVELKMASPDVTEITTRLEALEKSVTGLQEGLSGYQIGVGQKHSKWGWIVGGLGILVGVAVAVVTILIDQKVI
jgi:deoxycytidine triphosphate deaminase